MVCNKSIFNNLKNTSEQEFHDIIRDDGLIKIFKNTCTQIIDEKESFLRNHQNLLEEFFDENIIDCRIFPEIWNNLTARTCKYKCPWCGMPCDGSSKDCNDLYEPRERVKQGAALNQGQRKHSCQFHRDDSINGATECKNGRNTHRLYNAGSCPAQIESEIKIWKRFNGESEEMTHLSNVSLKTKRNLGEMVSQEIGQKSK